VQVLLALKHPSLNDLQMAGLLCQVVTLICGVFLLLIGTHASNEGVNFVLGCDFLLSAFVSGMLSDGLERLTALLIDVRSN
jgi:hypothetical protein